MNQLKKQTKNIQRLFYGGTGLICWPQFWELHDIIDHDVIERLDLKYLFFFFLSANDNSKRKRHEHRSVAESASDW